MHAAEGKRRSQSVASLISDLTPGRTVHWVTGSSAPCLSIFKPVLFETGLPPQGPSPSDKADGAPKPLATAIKNSGVTAAQAAAITDTAKQLQPAKAAVPAVPAKPEAKVEAKTAFQNLRIGVPADLGVSLHPDTAAAYALAQERMKAAGATLIPVCFPTSLAD